MRRQRGHRWIIPVTALTLAGIAAAPPAAAAPNTQRISVSSADVQADSSSFASAPSGNGKLIAFDSAATNLVANDTNVTQDVFVRNKKAGKTSIVSIRSNGAQANGPSSTPDISESGRYVVFQSNATNLVANDGNGVTDIFIRDRNKDKTKRVSTRSNGGEANGPSLQPSISADGRYLAFASSASNLVSGDSNGQFDVFVKNLKNGKVTRVSERSNGTQGNGTSSDPSISPDGRHVVFTAAATNLVPDDSNGAADVFFHTRSSKKTIRVSVASNGAQGDGVSFIPTVSNGKIVAFVSGATNLVPNDTNAAVDVFVRNVGSKQTRRMSVSNAGIEGNLGSGNSAPALSEDGRYIVFPSDATNLVGSDTNAVTDIFRRDRKKQTIKRVSVRFDGTEANGVSGLPDISLDGRFVPFASNATNLVGGDTNAVTDVFLRGAFK
jgi:Tol biopolymer transport system component